MTPDDIGLCTLADVRELMGTPAADTRRDARVDDLIVRASAMVMNYTLREFAPGGPMGLPVSGERQFENADGDFGQVDFKFDGMDLDKTGTITVTLTSDDEEAYPDLVAPAGFLRFAGRHSEPVYHSARVVVPAGYNLGITIASDKWGWPSVPPDVREATAMTVAHLMTAFPAAGRPDPMGVQPMFEPRGLPRTAFDILARYRIGA